MAISTNVRVNGAWKQLNEIYAKVDGVWEEMDEVYVKVNGVWEKVFPSFLPGSIIYSTSGTHLFVVPSGVTTLNYIIIGAGAGGAGGSDDDPYCTGGGGGGAGGLVNGTLAVISGETLTCIVGNGGAGGGPLGGRGGAGGNSYIRRGVTDLALAPGGQRAGNYATNHWPYGGAPGNAYSEWGTNGGITSAHNTSQNGGNGGGVPGYSVAATSNGEAGKVPGGGGGGGLGKDPSGSTAGGKGGRGRIYLSW